MKMKSKKSVVVANVQALVTCNQLARAQEIADKGDVAAGIEVFD